MCGRYTIATPPQELAKRFDATLPAESVQPRYNAAPTQTLPVLLNEDDAQRHIHLLRWGLIPHWAKSPKVDYRMINARAETLEDKATFRKAFEQRRCLVLADSFYEWQKTPEGKKIPMRIMLKSEDPFAFAGLWESWKDHETGEVIRSFTIVTTEANELVTPIHNRMPVMLLPENENAWIDNAAGPDVWRELMRPYPPDLMKTYPVSPLVNSPTNDTPAVLTSA
jgi:putative SOS response-associated peptidase YedK